MEHPGTPAGEGAWAGGYGCVRPQQETKTDSTCNKKEPRFTKRDSPMLRPYNILGCFL